jgi:hypothetical protein
VGKPFSRSGAGWPRRSGSPALLGARDVTRLLEAINEGMEKRG